MRVDTFGSLEEKYNEIHGVAHAVDRRVVFCRHNGQRRH